MSLLDEQLVEEWLNRQGFFTMRGIKCGGGEIDLLAIRELPDGMERWHVEVQISFNPIGYIGGDQSAKLRTPGEVRAGVEQWVDKKFTRAIKSERRLAILPESEWQYVLVHGISKYPVELEIMNELGVRTIPYIEVLSFLLERGTKESSSVASNIIDIIGYTKRQLAK
jgi:Holliday junction resolvase-like predicted endonuclease